MRRDKMNWEKHFFFLFFGTEFFMGGWSYVGKENERYKGRNGKKRKEKGGKWERCQTAPSLEYELYGRGVWTVREPSGPVIKIQWAPTEDSRQPLIVKLQTITAVHSLPTNCHKLRHVTLLLRHLHRRPFSRRSPPRSPAGEPHQRSPHYTTATTTTSHLNTGHHSRRWVRKRCPAALPTGSNDEPRQIRRGSSRRWRAYLLPQLLHDLLHHLFLELKPRQGLIAFRHS